MDFKLTPEEREKAIEFLVECVKIPTVSNLGPINGSYNRCAEFLVEKLHEVGANPFILPESVPNKPIVVGVIKGRDQSLPGILLNSHYDVVPADLNHWNVDPFLGVLMDGKLYGRGTQDMKSVCVQYIVALKKLQATHAAASGDSQTTEAGASFKPLRNIFITYVPDEEIGGVDGMKVLIESEWYNSIKIDLALDEGLASTDNSYSIFYGERLPWWVKFTARGPTGHASRFIEDSAVEQLLGVTSRAMKFRQEQKEALHGGGSSGSPSPDVCGCAHAVAAKRKISLGDVTSLNITALRAGVQAAGVDVINVIPVAAECAMDIRISPHTDPNDILQMFNQWCRECSLPANTKLKESFNKSDNVDSSAGLQWEILNNASRKHAVTSINSTDNPWWGIFTSKLTSCSSTTESTTGINAEIFPAATDSRFLRSLGVKAFGFSPMKNSEILLHEHNENIEVQVFIDGCTVYSHLILELANTSSLTY